jgi:hypothetical protein
VRELLQRDRETRRWRHSGELVKCALRLARAGSSPLARRLVLRVRSQGFVRRFPTGFVDGGGWDRLGAWICVRSRGWGGGVSLVRWGRPRLK